MYAYAYWSDYPGKGNVSLEQLIQQQKNDLLVKAKKAGRNYNVANKQEVEEALNFFLPNQNGSSTFSIKTGFSTNEIQQIEQAIKKKIESAISSSNITNINWNNLTAIANGGQAALAGGTIDKGGLRFELGNVSDWNRFDSINERLQVLAMGIKHLPIGTVRGDLLTTLKSLTKQWKELQQTASITHKSFFGNQEKFIKTGKNSNFITELNKLMLSFKQEASSYITGEIGEMWAAASANLYALVTQEAFNDVNSVLQFIDQSSMTGLMGKQTETHYINSKNLSSLKYYQNGDQKINFSGIQGSGAKQGKIDFQLSLPDENNTTYDLSIKNYADTTNKFTIHSGSSILFLLQSYENLLDYFINIVPRENVPKDNDKTIDSPSVEFSGMQNLIKISLLAQGLMGAYTTDTGNITNNSADTFVVFKNGKYNVYFIADIIEKLVENINNLNQFGYINNSEDNSNLDFSNFRNTWVGGQDERSRAAGLERTSALLAQLHQIKMKMTITVDALI